VVHFHEVIVKDDFWFIITENCTGGDLLNWIIEGRNATQATIKSLFTEICRAVQYLHHEGMAHNDLKPENVIPDANGTAKLINCGYAKTDLLADDDEKYGTLMYAAPELFRRGSYHTQQAAIWSFRIVLSTMTTGKFPFDGASECQIIRQIIHGQLTYAGELTIKWQHWCGG
jgi:serine/threonine protein kinase